MSERTAAARGLAALGISMALASAPLSAADAGSRPFRAGVNYDFLSRTVVWEGDTEASLLKAHILSAVAEKGLGDAVTFSLAAGLSLSDFRGLVFDGLPITLELGSAAVRGIALAAEVTAVLARTGDFEIGAAGRFVYSFGLDKTWPLEDFAVEGEAVGRANWMEASAGARVTYKLLGGFVPYIEAAAHWLTADLTMDETLDDLEGLERKQVKGDLSFSASLGADIEVSERLKVRFKAGALPYEGGVDAIASVGILTSF